MEAESCQQKKETDQDEPSNKKLKLEVESLDLPTVKFDEISCNTEGLSKKQRRRLERTQKWLQNKSAKRAREKEKLKMKKLKNKLENIVVGPSKKALKKCTMAASNCKIRIVIDCSFDDLMGDRDMGKCIKQILHCYSLNRRSMNPMQLYITNLNGKCEKEMEKHTGYRNWDINFCSDSYTEVFNQDELVYLTSESDNVIEKLEDDKVYIIGALVDHNSQKGLCYRVAVDQKISHGQLPISDFIDMKSRKVLTIDHVFEILLAVSSGKLWKDAFLQVLPSRKGAVIKFENEKRKSSYEIGASSEVQINNES